MDQPGTATYKPIAAFRTFDQPDSSVYHPAPAAVQPLPRALLNEDVSGPHRPLYTIQGSVSQGPHVILDHYEEEEEEPTYASIGTQTDYRESSVQCGKGDFAPLPRRPLSVAQLRQSPVSTLVKTRTERRKLGEHERAKANFEASLGTPTTAAEFEDRLRKLRAWESSTWATREASLQGDSKAWLDRMQEALLSREAAAESVSLSRVQRKLQAYEDLQASQRPPSPPARSAAREAIQGHEAAVAPAWQKTNFEARKQQASLTQAHQTLQMLHATDADLGAKVQLMTVNASSKLPSAAVPQVPLRQQRQAQELKQHLATFKLQHANAITEQQPP